ncbi:MAG: hypothetical protein HOQ27_15855 [Dermatophilaceae bacterium]|nr:hypothetical protein [Dermatophilaceae bacterium]NUR17197.1 hypothetical protein [Dermatophilaceae bacterium]
MSQMTATARPLRVPRRGPAPTPLRVIPARITRTGNGAFVAICIGLLTGGLISLLLLNTALAQGSLALGDLNRESARLGDTAGNLQEEIDRASATGALARSASELGMVRMNTRGYVDLAKGTVTGGAEPATTNNAFPIVTSPTPPAVTSRVKKLLSSATTATNAASHADAQQAAKAKADKQKADKAASDQAKNDKARNDKARAAGRGATPTVPGATNGTSGTPTLGTTD